MGGGPTLERGRPARMHSRCVPLSFPAIRRPATKRDGSPHRQGCGPASRRVHPRGARVTGGGPTRERGRPARMHSRCVPLSLPAMGRPATLPAGAARARPKQSPGAVAGRAGRSRAFIGVGWESPVSAKPARY